MKKVVLGIVLLAIVIGVGYVRSLRHQSQKATAYERGKQEGAEVATEYQGKLDSLDYVVEQQRIEFAQSVWMKEMIYRSMYDSLAKIIDSGKRREDSLKKELTLSQQQAGTEDASVGSTRRKASRHEQILGYYKKRYQSLPKDLSPYEKRVALAEIRDETAQKFAISQRELDKIRSDNKLDY